MSVIARRIRKLYCKINSQCSQINLRLHTIRNFASSACCPVHPKYAEWNGLVRKSSGSISGFLSPQHCGLNYKQRDQVTLDSRCHCTVGKTELDSIRQISETSFVFISHNLNNLDDVCPEKLNISSAMEMCDTSTCTIFAATVTPTATSTATSTATPTATSTATSTATPTATYTATPTTTVTSGATSGHSTVLSKSVLRSVSDFIKNNPSACQEDDILTLSHSSSRSDRDTPSSCTPENNDSHAPRPCALTEVNQARRDEHEAERCTQSDNQNVAHQMRKEEADATCVECGQNVADVTRKEEPDATFVECGQNVADVAMNEEPNATLVECDLSALYSETFSEAYKKLMGSDKPENTKKRKKKSKTSSSSSVCYDDKGCNVKLVPNYFVAIQVNNPQIHRCLRMVQDHIISQKPALSSALVPLATLHLTVMVMYLENQDVTRAQSALEECREKLCHLASDHLVLHIKGVSNFRDNVVFANISDGPEKERLCQAADIVREVYASHGLPQTDDRDFKPHLTIMKLSKAPKLRKKGMKKISPSLYEEVTSDEFGFQTVRGLQLCAMMKPKDQAGYYHMDHQVDFVPASHTEPPTESFEYKAGPDSSTDPSPVSELSERLATDILTQAMEAIRSEQLANSRKRKRLDHTDDVSQKHNKKPRKHCATYPGTTDRGPPAFVVELHRQLSWTFEQGKIPEIDQVKKQLKEIHTEEDSS